MKKELTFCLKETVYVRNKKIPLSDLCSINGANDKKLTQAFFDVSKKAVTLTAFETAKRLEEIYPDCNATNLGPTVCNVFLNNKEKSKFITLLKVFFLCVVMFFGGAVAIMTFHEDVDMRDVHSNIYTFFTGKVQASVPIVSIPYTAGISIGFILLFGLFNRKKSHPTVLDLDVHKHENALREFMTEKNKSNNE